MFEFMTTLYTETFGQGESVLMLHGWAMHAGMWRDFAEEIAKTNRVLCVDLPGHGRSPSDDVGKIDVWAEKILAAMPKEACHLIGWSLGGNIALYLAEKYPGRVKSIILIASNPHFLQEESWQGISKSVLEGFANNLQTNVNATLIRFLSLQVKGLPDGKAALKKIKVLMLECKEPEFRDLMLGLELLQSTDSREALQKIACPVLLVLGDKDTLVPVSVAEGCQLLRPKLEVQCIESAGHMPFITHKQQVLALVQSFFKRVE